MLYRLFTENKNLKVVENIVSRYFEGFTILKADGYWKLIKEGSLVIEVTDPKTNVKYMESTATWLNQSWRTGDNVRIYGLMVTALVKFPVGEKRVELLLKFLEELHGWKEKE